jgi:hypothetical protein
MKIKKKPVLITFINEAAFRRNEYFDSFLTVIFRFNPLRCNNKKVSGKGGLIFPDVFNIQELVIESLSKHINDCTIFVRFNTNRE